MKHKIIFILAGIILSSFVLPGPVAYATIRNAASCEQAAVQGVVNLAVDGDTVTVPAGNCTWAAAMQIGTKAIILLGAGTGQTNITHNLIGTQAHILQFTEHPTMSTRITGFSFLNGSYDRRFIECNGDGNYTSAPMRVDHNSFTSNGSSPNGSPIQLDFNSCRGLVDNNTFAASYAAEMIHNRGPGSAGWSANVTPGSSNALYIDHNTFNNNNSGSWGAQSAMESFDGARTVARFNTFNDNQIDQHGGAGIGVRWFEFYENTFNTSAGYGQDKYFDIRAGSGVIFNNHHTGAASNAQIVFRDESRPGDFQYDVGEGINRNHWSPAYAWGNDASMGYSRWDSTRILEGVNYIISATQPDTTKRWQLTSDTASTTYHYTRFTYPYPLDAAGLPVDNSPTLAVTVTGTGTVNGGGITCDSTNPLTCSKTFANTTTSVTLTATIPSGSTFAWSGACTGSATTCTVLVDSYKSVSATFTPPPPLINDGDTLTVTLGTPAQFNLAVAGNYKLSGVVTAADANSNSVYFDFDNNPGSGEGTGDDARAWDLNFPAVAQAQIVTWRGNASTTCSMPVCAQFNPKTFTLTAGFHTLYVNTREAGATIQAIKFMKTSGLRAPGNFRLGP